MFTGIVTDIGEILSLEDSDQDAGKIQRKNRRVKIATHYLAKNIAAGSSISCSGCCLTVVDKGADQTGDWFMVDISQETLDRTTLESWTVGKRINLERAARLGDEIGGHIVTGHVDCTAMLVDSKADGSSQRLEFIAPQALGGLIATKGSIAIDGVSITVNSVKDEGDHIRFGVNVIPYTRNETTLGLLSVHDRVNLEFDILARYIARLIEHGKSIDAA